MGVTRSQSDPTEHEERNTVEQERRRRLLQQPTASPTDAGSSKGGEARTVTSVLAASSALASEFATITTAPTVQATDVPATERAVHTAGREDPPHSSTFITRRKSPTRSFRSTTSVTARLRQVELEAAEKLAELDRRKIEMETELVR